MSLLHGYGRNFTTHWFKLSHNQHPLVISFDPQSVAGEHDSPSFTACLFPQALHMQSAGWCGGCFAEMCYSHQTGLVKSQHVVLLLKHPRESKHQADRACISSSVSSFSSPLPGTPHSAPTFSFFLAPHKSYCIWVTAAFNPLPPFFYLPKTIRSGVWPREAVCHLCSLCPKSASLSAPRVTTHESQRQRTMWDQMFFFS